MLSRIFSRGGNSLNYAMPRNPLICQATNTTQVIENGRYLQQLHEPITMTLISKDELATDSFVYRFALPEEHATLGHFTCQYLKFEATIDGEKFERFYHPLSKVTDEGYVDLLIKVYLRNFQHQQGGLFTQFIDKMKLGNAQMKITAIGGDIHYLGDSSFMVRDKESKEMVKRQIDRVGMIAAGSGITPMFQLVQTVAESPSDKTALSLIYSNRTPFDIILDEDLTDYEQIGKLCYFPLVQNPDENWIQGQGRVSEKMIKAFMPEPYLDEKTNKDDDSLIIVCGPPKLRESVGKIIEEDMGWHNAFIYD